MKSPKSCLNFLHNFSSVCESLLRLICLNKLGPKRNGRSELCWEPKINYFINFVLNNCHVCSITAKIINGSSHIYRIRMVKHVDIYIIIVDIPLSSK